MVPALVDPENGFKFDSFILDVCNWYPFQGNFLHINVSNYPRIESGPTGQGAKTILTER